jgi:hypothetical protein
LWLWLKLFTSLMATTCKAALLNPKPCITNKQHLLQIKGDGKKNHKDTIRAEDVCVTTDQQNGPYNNQVN